MADARSETSSIGDDVDSTFSAFDRPNQKSDEAYRSVENNLAQSSRIESYAEQKHQGYTTLHLVIGALWAVAVAVGGMMVGIFSRLTGKDALKTRNGSNYYDIVRPSIAPVPVFFVIIWTVFFLLYGLGGVAMIEPWIRRGVGSDKLETARLSLGVIVYVAILALLYAWMPVFANAEQPKTAAFLLIGILILYMPLLIFAYKTSWWSAALMAPLFGWLVVALVMNAESVQKWNLYNAKQTKTEARETIASVGGVKVQKGSGNVPRGASIDMDDVSGIGTKGPLETGVAMTAEQLHQLQQSRIQQYLAKEEALERYQQMAREQYAAQYAREQEAKQFSYYQVAQQATPTTAVRHMEPTPKQVYMLRSSPEAIKAYQREHARREQMMTHETMQQMNPINSSAVSLSLDTSDVEMVRDSHQPYSVSVDLNGRLQAEPSQIQPVLPLAPTKPVSNIEL